MLSLKKCREILGKDHELSEEEMEALRAQLYMLGEVAIEMSMKEVSRQRGDQTRKPVHQMEGISIQAKCKKRRRTRSESNCGRLN